MKCMRAVGVALILASATVTRAQIAKLAETTSAPTTHGKLPFKVSPETTAIVSPLQPDGTPDYWVAFNQLGSKGMTPENNAYVAWLSIVDTKAEVGDGIRARFLKLCGAPETVKDAQVLVHYEDYLKSRGLSGDGLDKARTVLVNAGMRLWRAEEEPELAAYLTKHEKQLSLLAEGMKREQWWFPYLNLSDNQESLILGLLPALRGIREAGNVLCARATLRARAGDFDGFLEDVKTVRRLARHVGSGRSVLERLVGLAIDSMASNTAGAAAGSGVLTEAQCRTLLAELASQAPLSRMTEVFDAGERWTLLYNVELVAEGKMVPFQNNPDVNIDLGDSEGGSLMRAMDQTFGSIERGEVDWDAVLKLVNQNYDEEVSALRAARLLDMQVGSMLIEKRMKEWGDAVKASAATNAGQPMRMQPGETREAYTQRVGRAILALCMTSGWRAETIQRRTGMFEEMAKVMVATAAERAKSGAWPKVPALAEGMGDVPRDIYSEGQRDAVKYVVSEKGACVYSIGENRKDDGGINEDKAVDQGKDDLVIGAK